MKRTHRVDREGLGGIAPRQVNAGLPGEVIDDIRSGVDKGLTECLLVCQIDERRGDFVIVRSQELLHKHSDEPVAAC